MKFKYQEITEFFDTLTPTIKDWSYFVNYEKVVYEFDKFKEFINKIGTVTEFEFKTKFTTLTKENSEWIKFTPLLVAYRKDKVAIKVFKSKIIEFDFNDCTTESALFFLEKTGFFRIFSQLRRVDFPSYYFGIEVGFSTNGRKNRGGSLMENNIEKLLLDYYFDFKAQATIKSINNNFNLDIKTDNQYILKRRFDFAFMLQDYLFLCEANFFATSGSKIKATLGEFTKLSNDINSSFSNLQGLTVVFILISDGFGLKKAQGEIKDFKKHSPLLFNISGFQSFLNDLKTSNK